ncbi:MAG TPA: hypothetical protein VGI70_18030, partial [Polyangiales bacterium]
MKRIGVWTVVAVVISWCARVAADDAVLHEYVPNLEADEVAAALRGEGDGAEHADDRAAEPNGANANDSSPAPNSRVPHSENFRPDRLTSLEDGLDYYEAFNPSIAPFKRMMALDITRLDVDGKTPVLGVRDARHRAVPIETPDAPPPDPRPRDRFEGELDLDFHDDAVQRLPSVSPESRILSLTTKPPIAARVERDGADNFYLRAEGSLPEGPVHVSFLTDAPRAYFGTIIPRVPLRSLADNDVSLAPSIQRRALHFATQLGITQRSDLRTAIETLTRYFRAFVESATPPENSGDLYLDLVRSSKG